MGRSHFQDVLALVQALLVAAGLWIAAPGLGRGALWGAGLLALVWGLLLVRALGRPPRGRLRYAGPRDSGGTPVEAEVPAASAWAWGDAKGLREWPVQRVTVVLDWPRRQLLRLQGPVGVPRWVWVEREQAPHDWLALRRALVCDAHRSVT